MKYRVPCINDYKFSFLIMYEVKSGKAYNRHSALNRALATPNYGMGRGVVLAETNVQVQDRIDYLPVYMVAVLDRETIASQGM